MRLPRRVVVLSSITLFVLSGAVIATAALRANGAGNSADVPPLAQGGGLEGEQYLRLRAEYIGQRRGLTPGTVLNPALRSIAVSTRQRQERSRAPALATASWTPIGPANVANGQAVDGSDTAISGRVTAIAVDPSNNQIVYLGTAQGGVWRTLDGGTTWTALFDQAESLEIGALAIAPSNPSTVYVGTGEPNNGGDTFFGLGVYRIDNADTTATLVGPINPSMTYCANGPCSATFTTTAFGGRGISRILVHPTDPATIFVSTGAAFSGMGFSQLANTVPPLGLRGVYRSTNATSPAASVTFQKLAVTTQSSLDVPGTGNTSISDLAFANNDPNTLLVGVQGTSSPGGGVFRSTNALAGAPTFTQTLTPGFTGLWHKLSASGNTIFVTSNEPADPPVTGSGRLRKSVDGGATWSTPLLAADGFCANQCSYDNPVGIDPNTSGATLRVYIGGNARSDPPANSDLLKVSNDGGNTFTRDDTGLHADAHSIVFGSSANPSTVWFGNDGGVWKRAADAAPGSAWTNLNVDLGTLQFQSVAVHPTDPAFTIGGTQDNGTQKQTGTVGSWAQGDFGDGGYALIDQNAADTTNVTMYHTYFNASGVNGLIGFARTNLASCANKGDWEVRGFINGGPGNACDGSVKTQANGISSGDAVEFYAPMALGPGTPNTVYFGTQRLYRSIDKGDTMATVSQNPIVAGQPITTIAISPDDDDVRIVGLQNGTVWATTTGSVTLTQMTGLTAPTNPASATNKWVGRVAIDPNDPNTAYATFSYYAPAGQGVFKTTNLNAATPTWTAAGTGIPSVPVNAFVVDPNDSTDLYAGTDIGVYYSSNGGASWAPYGTGLPAVAVFDMAIVQPGTTTEKLRVATHGRSMWQIETVSAPTAVAVRDFSARRTGARVLVSWRTASERGAAGFNVWRSAPTGWRKLNAKLIRARHPGSARGDVYRFLDRSTIRRHRYTYRLELVGLNGTRRWLGTAASVAR